MPTGLCAVVSAEKVSAKIHSEIETRFIFKILEQVLCVHDVQFRVADLKYYEIRHLGKYIAGPCTQKIVLRDNGSQVWGDSACLKFQLPRRLGQRDYMVRNSASDEEVKEQGKMEGKRGCAGRDGTDKEKGGGRIKLLRLQQKYSILHKCGLHKKDEIVDLMIM